MVSFFIALGVLIIGYIFYGIFVEKVFGMNNSIKTPAYVQDDGVDYVPMPTWKVFMIQFLNIAGLGPIFGAILGIAYGPAAFLWIALGTIFGGGVHDYLSGMISLRKNGVSLPDVIGDELGKSVKQASRVFSVLLLILVGAVFVINPAALLAQLSGGFFSLNVWICIIFGYYILATLLPIDKLIGNLYPVFGFALLFMAVGIFVALVPHLNVIPEFTDGLYNRHTNPESNPIFPMMFISIACGAVSGFHATQSPLMARCIKQEKYGRVVFYGAMVSEGIVALIWAAATIVFFKGSFTDLNAYETINNNAPSILVNNISINWLGAFGGVLAILGVVAAPITTGDTALRSARLIVADCLKYDQTKILKRLIISVPIFILVFFIMQMKYDVLWRYFAWSNQTLATFTLWAVTIYLAKLGKKYIISLIPAIFMTMVTTQYILFAKEGFRIDYNIALVISSVVTIVCMGLFAKFVIGLRTSSESKPV